MTIAQPSRDTLQALLDAVLAWIANSPPLSPATADFLHKASQAARSAQPFAAARTAAALPVRAHFHAAAAAATSGPLADVARRLTEAEPSLAWLQNPNYTAAAMGQAYVDNYGYLELVGPQRAFQSTRLLIGFLLLGPHTLYPDHDHPAEEVYVIVSGDAHWRRGDGDWKIEPAGAVIHHVAHIRHAMRTGSEPLLALYFWMGDIGVAAALTKTNAGGI